MGFLIAESWCFAKVWEIWKKWGGNDSVLLVLLEFDFGIFVIELKLENIVGDRTLAGKSWSLDGHF